MSGVRVIFSPHTADPRCMQDLVYTVFKAQLGVAMAVWDAQAMVLQAMAMAQLTVLETACRATPRPG